MTNLSALYPSLTLFSDLDWNTVSAEYEQHYIHLSFPEYLQEKALEGDCPPYLFELAFYEHALFEAKNSDETFPHVPGIYLNPTTLFLRLEFDVAKMIDEAQKGQINVVEKDHILAVYRDQQEMVHTIPLTEEELSFLQEFEDGPKTDHSFLSHLSPIIFQDLVRKKLILDLSGVAVKP